MRRDWATARRHTLQEDDDQNVDEAWLRRMKNIITDEGLGYVVSVGIPPDPLKNPESAATIKPEELCSWRESVREDMKALQILQSALPDSLFRKTLSVTSSKNLWNYLNEVTVHVAENGDFTSDENIWTISFTNSNHMTPNDKLITSLDRSRHAQVKFTSGGSALALGVGDVTGMTEEGEKTIKDVLYVPGFKGNALSVSQMERSGFEVEIDRDRCTIWDRTTGKIFGDTMREERGFCLRFDVVQRKR